MKLNFSASLAILLLLLTFSHIEADMAPAPAPPPANSTSICDGKCVVRCSKASQEVRCLKYCGICCQKCDYCVPSGTAGNKDECPCYRDMKNSKGKSKCP